MPGRAAVPGRGAAAAVVALLSLLSAPAGGQSPVGAPLPGRGQEPGVFRISINVDLVVLHATVSDRRGRYVSGLRQQDFTVLENGLPQRIRLFRREDIPVSIGLVVDHSGSMRPKLTEVVAAARAFVIESNPEDEMFVINFNERVTLGLPSATPFSSDAGELERAIASSPVGGQTALYDAVAKALDQLQRGTKDKKALVVISDGGDNASRTRLAEVLTKAGQSGALVYTVGIFMADDRDRNPDALRQLSRATGGEAFFPRELSDVVSTCGRVARDIRNQYTIGYLPSPSAEPGAYRSIRVTVGEGGGGYRVRTRTGYVASGAATPGQAAVSK